MNIHTSRLAERILKLHDRIDSALGTIANYPNDCDQDFYDQLLSDKAGFQELALIAGIPVEPPLYWQSVDHFVQCYYCESSERENARHQANINPVQVWLGELTNHVEPFDVRSPEPSTLVEIVQGISTFAWQADFIRFCEVCGFQHNPSENSDAQQKWSDFQMLQKGLNAFDLEKLNAIVQAGTS